VQYGPAGGGSFPNREDKVIMIDSDLQNNPAKVVQTISHETGHVLNPHVADTSSKAAFVQGWLKEEGAATMKNIQVQREIMANGGPNIGLVGNPANHTVYNAAYNQYLLDGNAAAARSAIGGVYATGEKTSNTGQTYQDYYGDLYDQNYGNK